MGRRISLWGLGLYTIGSFAMFLLVGLLVGWSEGATVGAVIALFGAAIYLWYHLYNGQRFWGVLAGTLMLASFPIGMLVLSNAAHGLNWLLTTLIIGSTGAVLGLFVQLGRWAKKRFGT